MIAKLKADRWTLMKVAAMTTNAIEEQLRSYGVRFTRDGFLAVTHGRSSAWSIADEWLRAGATCRGADEDFLGMAACELWKRILPERPSVEMIDDWMQDGYLLLEDGKPSEACDLWWKVWSALRTHHFSPAMSTMHRADDVFRGSQSIFNWSQDFEMEVRNAALDNAHFNEIGGQFCEEWLAQFVSESQPIPLNFGQCRAELTANSGDEVRALELFDELPTLAPEEPWAYVFAADAHAGVFHRRVLPFAPEKAEPLYRRALSLARNADDRHAIQDRLSDLRARVLGPHD